MPRRVLAGALSHSRRSGLRLISAWVAEIREMAAGTSVRRQKLLPMPPTAKLLASYAE